MHVLSYFSLVFKGILLILFAYIKEMFLIALYLRVFYFPFGIRLEMSKGLVDYGFSSDAEGNNIVRPKKTSKVDLGRLRIPNSLPTTPWEIADELEVTEQWPALDATTFSSAAPTNTIGDPLDPQRCKRGNCVQETSSVRTSNLMIFQ